MKPGTPGPSRRRLREASERTSYLARRLGRALRDRRLAVGWSQRALGASVGLSQQEVSRLELGNGTDAGLDTWAACAAAVGLQLAAFLEQAPGAFGVDARDVRSLGDLIRNFAGKLDDPPRDRTLPRNAAVRTIQRLAKSIASNPLTSDEDLAQLGLPLRREDHNDHSA